VVVFHLSTMMQHSGHFHIGPHYLEGEKQIGLAVNNSDADLAVSFRHWKIHCTEFSSWFNCQINSATIASFRFCFLICKKSSLACLFQVCILSGLCLGCGLGDD
jgi:hypothetical protein